MVGRCACREEQQRNIGRRTSCLQFEDCSLNHAVMSQQYRNETERDAAARADEEQYVHSVYENIAQHFSRTRYKVGFAFLKRTGFEGTADCQSTDARQSFLILLSICFDISN